MSEQVVRVNSLQEGVEAVQHGAKFAFTCKSLHDNPPGDWYITVEVVCCDETAADKTGLRLKSFQAGLPVRGEAYFTEFMMAPDRKPDEQIAKEDEALMPQVEAKAEEIAAMLGRFADELPS